MSQGLWHKFGTKIQVFKDGTLCPWRSTTRHFEGLLLWIFVPRSGPLDSENEGTVSLRKAANYSPDVTSYPTAVRTSNFAMFVSF